MGRFLEPMRSNHSARLLGSGSALAFRTARRQRICTETWSATRRSCSSSRVALRLAYVPTAHVGGKHLRLAVGGLNKFEAGSVTGVEN